ncbi:SIMPL domain-containing protein [Mesorhizobium sp. BAC0120]|uniref:SIMPL domain-containing protein n=1 Tax=Mesorhizobium sp. BAC0120 TaxID=3090670 RepID=UPI00298C02E1|nr:SIMPL domain-containing protein [Mesorhizobium sp. BAC0120]MDW6023054.1 SIMPL domain-containing protein [Mesorhizobium sp. BAC0120]
MTKKLLAAALAAAIALPAVAHAAEPPPRRIVVMGEGEATVKPDIALLSLSVMREAATAREALDANNKAMADVIAAMKGSGVADRDLQTAGVQINPRYDFQNKPDGSQESKLVAYQVTNSLSVRVRDLSKTGEILDKSVSLGVNQGGGVTFTNDDPSATLKEARKKAVADAIDRAKTLTEAAGVKLGQVMEISDVAFRQPPVPLAAKAFDRAAEAVPVEAGENSYRVQVNVTFELD